VFLIEMRRSGRKNMYGENPVVAPHIAKKEKKRPREKRVAYNTEKELLYDTNPVVTPKEEKKRPREEEDNVPTPLQIAKTMGNFNVDLLKMYCKSASSNNEAVLKLLQEIAKEYYDTVLVSSLDIYQKTDLARIELVKQVQKLYAALKCLNI
jgi:hypothetical protein